MDFIRRFFGQVQPADCDAGELLAQPVGPDSLSLQLLLGDALDLDPAGIIASLRDYHPDMADARCELDGMTQPYAEVDELIPDATVAPGLIGLVGWGRHMIQMIGIAAPMPADVLWQSLQPAHIAPELKDRAAQHRCHLLLFYAGTESDRLEQYVALTALGAALAPFGCEFILNEVGRSAIPVGMVLRDPEQADEDMLGVIRSMPLSLLFCGAVKIEIEQEPGIWLRTFGSERLKLPDLAMHAASDEEARDVFYLLANLLAYLRETDHRFTVGSTLEVGKDRYLRVRAPQESEASFLSSETELLVIEPMHASDIREPS